MHAFLDTLKIYGCSEVLQFNGITANEITYLDNLEVGVDSKVCVQDPVPTTTRRNES